MTIHDPQPTIHTTPRWLTPIAFKELGARMHSRSATMMLTLFIGMVSGLAVLLYTFAFAASSRRIGTASGGGATLFYFLVAMQLIACAFVAPMAAAGAISAERQRGTLQLLRTTLLTPSQIVAAKFLAAIGFTLLLILATLPLFGLPLLIGGIEATEVVMALVVILSSAILFTTIGLYVSSRSATTLNSRIVTFAVVATLMIGIPIVFLVGTSSVQGALGFSRGTPGIRNAAEFAFALLSSLSPTLALPLSRRHYEITNDAGWFRLPLFSTTSGVDVPSPYLVLSVIYCVASIVLVVLAIRRVAKSET
jgi:ABC-type transport system involved in multi-copper enzyme maturation permease subunit